VFESKHVGDRPVPRELVHLTGCGLLLDFIVQIVCVPVHQLDELFLADHFGVDQYFNHNVEAEDEFVLLEQRPADLGLEVAQELLVDVGHPHAGLRTLLRSEGGRVEELLEPLQRVLLHDVDVDHVDHCEEQNRTLDRCVLVARPLLGDLVFALLGLDLGGDDDLACFLLGGRELVDDVVLV